MDATPIYTAAKPQSRFIFRARHEDILRALHRYEYLNQRHLQRLFFGAKTANYGYGVMKELVAEKYCYAAVWHKKQAGKGENEYHLDTRGVAWLRQHGYPQKGRLRKDKSPESNLFWDHLVALNHALIAFDRYAANRPDVSIDLFLHDFDFQRRRHQVAVSPGGMQTVEPDGLIDFALLRRGTIERQAILVECDRGTEQRPADWFQKIDRLTAFIRGPLVAEYGITVVDVAVTTPDPKRREILRLWTKSALDTLVPGDDASQFYFTDADPAAMTPDAFVLSPHWYFVTDSEPVSLLDPSSH